MNKRIDKALDELIDAIEEEFGTMGRDGLNQVYMWGPFAGWSGHDILHFARRMKENKKVAAKRFKDDVHD
jgi:hypothetical protein